MEGEFKADWVPTLFDLAKHSSDIFFRRLETGTILAFPILEYSGALCSMARYSYSRQLLDKIWKTDVLSLTGYSIYNTMKTRSRQSRLMLMVYCNMVWCGKCQLMYTGAMMVCW